MIIPKPQGYDKAEAFTGGAALPAGRYICRIVNADYKQTTTGKPMLIFYFDIDEGEYEGYYRRVYSSGGTNAKWRGVYRQLAGGSIKSVSFFKGVITSIERTNSFTWDWDTESLKNKRMGVIMGREQYQADDGTLRWATKAVRIRSVDQLEEEPIPEDKPMQAAANPRNMRLDMNGETQNPYGTFVPVAGDEDVLPF